jgi:hypothetical protein
MHTLNGHSHLQIVPRLLANRNVYISYCECMYVVRSRGTICKMEIAVFVCYARCKTVSDVITRMIQTHFIRHQLTATDKALYLNLRNVWIIMLQTARSSALKRESARDR